MVETILTRTLVNQNIVYQSDQKYKSCYLLDLNRCRYHNCYLERSMLKLVKINYGDLNNTTQHSGWKWLWSPPCPLEHKKINQDLKAAAWDICKMNLNCDSWQDFSEQNTILYGYNNITLIQFTTNSKYKPRWLLFEYLLQLDVGVLKTNARTRLYSPSPPNNFFYLSV